MGAMLVEELIQKPLFVDSALRKDPIIFGIQNQVSGSSFNSVLRDVACPLREVTLLRAVK